MKCTGSVENVILRGIFHVISRFPLHFILYCGNVDYFLDSVCGGDLPNFLQQEERRKKTKLILRVLPTKPNYIIIYYSIIYYLGNIKSKETSEKVSLHENILTPIFCISILPLITR